MRRFTLLFAHALLVALCVPLHAQSATDESLVRAVATRWEEAWNRHDMKALAETWLIRAAQNTNLGNLAPHAAPGEPDPLPVKPTNPGKVPP
ncbi:MAG TPA: hypothetical protein VGX68_22185 [Thermoanaerobaculia bacterium]|nr:hypothetical protein [Thermoanaerobaculia bacterium]